MIKALARLLWVSAVLTATVGWAKQDGKSAAAHEHGLRLLIEKSAALTASTNATGATGFARSSFSVVNGRTNETFVVRVTNMPQTNATLQVMVTLDGGSPVSAGAILTDASGDGSLIFATNPGRHHSVSPVPAAIEPVSAIDHVDILDANSTVLMSGDILESGTNFHMHALARLTAPSGNAFGQAGIEARSGTNSRQTISFNAMRLPASTTVQIQVNGTTIATATTRRNGKLNGRFTIPSTIDPALITSIQILDSSNAVLLSATLPE